MTDYTKIADRLFVEFYGDHISLVDKYDGDREDVELRRFTTLSEINYWINHVESDYYLFNSNGEWEINGGEGRTFTLDNKEDILELFDQLREYGREMERKKLEESDPGLKQNSASRANKNETPIEEPEDQSLNGGDD